VSTGSALSLALTVEELLSHGHPGRVMLFLGTPCTFGPGKVLDINMKEKMRQHYNLINDVGIPYYLKAKSFYDKQAMRAVEGGFAVDIFIASQDQVGFAEMRNLCEWTGMPFAAMISDCFYYVFET
jgi:protein transport protein SEC23